MNKYVPSYLIKLHARGAMKGRFSKAFSASFIEVAIVFGISALLIALTPGGFNRFMLINQGTFSSGEEQLLYQASVINGFSGIVSLVSMLFAFISVGCSGVFLDIIRRKDTSVKRVFSYYNQWYVALVYPLLFGIVNYLTGLLPKAVEYLPAMEGVMMVVITMVDCTVLFLGFKLSFVNFALADNGCKSVVEAVKTSWRLTDGKTFVNLLALMFSFLGWFILSMFTLGLPMIYAIPYIEASLATLYDMTRSFSENAVKNEA